MSASANCQLLGRWRIVGADLWDRDFLDLCGPAYILFETGGHGEFAFGAVQGGMDLQYGKRTVFFTWQGFDEMDETSGSGSADSTMTARSRSSCRSTTATMPSS